MSQASNVLLTKSRAMFGKRLTGQNVSELLNCQTVTEVAAYLKNNTHYSYALRNIDDSNVHRGQLEAALDDDVAALMMTCPNTLGLFETHLPAIVEKLRQVMLAHEAIGARLTGTGSVVFGLFCSKFKAVAAALELRELCPEVFLATPV